MSHPAQSNGGFRPQEIRRRQFQEAAAITIDKQAQAIQQTREFQADLSKRVDVLEKGTGVFATDIDQAFCRLNAHIHRSFLGRLRWLFTGR